MSYFFKAGRSKGADGVKYPDTQLDDFDPSCAFCEIAMGSTPSFLVKRWTRFMAIGPQRPATVGHTLVIPMRHIPTIWELPDDLAQELLVRAKELAEVMRAKLELDGLNLVQSNGEVATQSIPHFHLHLVPRYTDDAMDSIWPDGAPVTDEQSEAAWGQLQAGMVERKA